MNKAGFVLLILMLIGAYSAFFEPYLVQLTYLDLRREPVGDRMRGLVAVHLTDLHIQKIGAREKKVLAMVRELNPDLIFLTGDFVKWRGEYGPALSFLKQLQAKYGVFAVLGDYDVSDSRKSCLFCHEKGAYGKEYLTQPVRFLRDEILSVKVGKEEIRIGGVGFGSHPEIRNLLAREDLPPQIFLSHNPLGFDEVPDHCETLVLSGDTHGGQIMLPSWIWRFIGYKKNEKYNYGFFSQGKKRAFVSRGIGMSHLPIRFFRRPEVVVIYF